MSKPKGLFDAAIWVLEKQRAIEDMAGRQVFAEKLHIAIRVLEAAGKVEKQRGLEMIDEHIGLEMEGYFGPPHQNNEACKKQDEGILEYVKILWQIRALLEALPDGEKEPKRYRCESCGKEFDKRFFSHSRAEDDGLGNPIEVECGPICEEEK